MTTPELDHPVRVETPWVQQVYGQRPAGMSIAEYERIVAEAAAQGQNVFFGSNQLGLRTNDDSVIPMTIWTQLGLAATVLIMFAVMLVVGLA